MGWNADPRRVVNPLATVLGVKDPAVERSFDSGPFRAVTNLGNDASKGSRQIVNSVASIWKGSGNAFTGVSSGDTEPVPPPVAGIPSIDTARQQVQENDRLRRRRGVLANIFGGSSNSQPTIAVKTLLGS